MTYTQADLDNLKAAFVSGATDVSIGDRRVSYRSLAEIAALIALIESQLNPPTEQPASSPNIVKVTFKKGS